MVLVSPFARCNANVEISLVSLGRSSFAAIERLCQQTEVLINEISDEGGAAAFINIRNDFLSV